MKIGKGEAAPNFGREVRQRADQQHLEQLQNGQARGKKGIGEETEVNVSLGRLIQSELGVEQLQAERREKVEKLKELIKAGEYNPSSEAVAEALGKELLVEISQSGQLSAENE